PALATPRWEAALSLEFAQRDGRSLLSRRSQRGPLAVQKTLHPEGDGVCHALVLHPPGGICAGDELAIDARVGHGAHALLTTPGAGKFYRSSGGQATQHLNFRIEDGAMLEWLPQETIVFDGARATLSTRIDLAAGAAFIGWEVVCLGRTAAGERFEGGLLATESRIGTEGKTLWLERGRIEGGSRLLVSPSGLAGQPVTATLLATHGEQVPGLIDQLRRCAAADGICGVTCLPRLFVARYLGPSAQSARAYFVALWQILRPALIGREAVLPRIWNT
ncbi:MAG: urease accessory protein UreD, partial [Rhodocyclaceae bacterium]